MKIKFTLFALFCLLIAKAQPEVDSWTMNEGQYASYWENTNGNPTNPNFVFYTTTVLADVTKVCYNDAYFWVKSEGMTTDMGQFLNPGAPAAQDYTFQFPRTPTVPASKTISPKIGAIGMLVNGVPIYGLSNAHYYNGSSNNGMGQGTWNVEVYKAEGFVLDATLGAHPQQQGAYHSHAKPYRLYSDTDIAEHSPIVGYAFDGYPVYGPYGYTDPNDSGSAVIRMRTGYSLRNITTRTTLPYGVALSSANYGPAVNNTYPIGTYAEDYEWLESNGGTLDKYNGRFCKTPEYPDGTYAYFVAIDAAGTPQFPYYIGIEYYGAPNTTDLQQHPNITIPGDAICRVPLGIGEAAPNKKMSAYPNPSTGNFTLSLPNLSGESLIEIFTVEGKKIFSATTTTVDTPITLSETGHAMLMVKVTNNGREYVTKMMMQ